MKINRGALIFGGGILAAALLIAGGVWIVSLFNSGNDGTQKNSGADFFSSLFPFGQSPANTKSGTGANGTETGPTGPAPSLREVSHAPVGGVHFQKNGALRYMERETGHVYETMSESLQITRISNTTIPGVQNVEWISDDTLVLQYLDENNGVRNYEATLASSTENQALTGKFLSGFSNIFSAGDGKNMIEGFRSSTGIVVLNSDVTEKTRKTLFVSPLRSWTIIPRGANLFVQTAPSSGLGYLYKVSEGLGLERIIDRVPGLMATPSASSTLIAYSATDTKNTRLFILNPDTGAVVASPVATLAVKCAWIPGNRALLFCGVPSSLAAVPVEDWLMGVQSFSDSAWVIDTARGTARVVRDLAKDSGEQIDIVNPQISPDGKYAVFINKNDLSLWSLELTPQ